MSVYLTEQGTVTQVWNDVKTLVEFAEKYPSIPLQGLSEGEAVSGQVLENGALVNPTLSDVALAARDREERDMLLATEVDPIVTNSLRWAGMSPSEQAAIAVYRQELLDVPQQAGFPKTHTWPNKP
tara:strand:- start:12923 stop:13300 length:378 start_codon:yes stop_codon:yes gene_type:complete